MVSSEDPLTQGTRLGIMAALSALPEGVDTEFGALRELLNLTAGNLSSHLRVLEEAGYITVQKRYVGRRPRTWLQATPAGREAFRRELETLQALARTAPRVRAE